jgi:undecaprenyl diphosphate synthase
MPDKVPTCIGIIMDGNRRWARERGLPTLEGHRQGYDKLKDVAKWAHDAGIKHLVVYALSTENWNRSEEEVNYLMDLFRTMVEDGVESLKKQNARARFVGDLARFPDDIRQRMAEINAEDTQAELDVWISASYGGRLEITEAARTLQKNGYEITEENIRKHMWTAGMPDPDLIIRTSGEQRLSNFLIWQAAYAELFFTDTYWPAFTKDEFNAILKAYVTRERRFGK